MLTAQDLKGKKILVLGLARSGISACRLLIKEQNNVTGYDIKNTNELDLPEDIANNIEIISSDPVTIDPAKYDLIIVSPGVPPDNSIIEKAIHKSIPVISELELGLQFIKNTKIIAVTGTNGKTTTCELIKYLTGGKVAGNMGEPLSGKVNDINNEDILILEVSSYQIPFSPSLVADIAILLNIFPEHLKWHKGFQGYLDSKKELFLRQKEDQVCIFNLAIDDIDNIIRGVKSDKYFFSLDKNSRNGVFIEKNQIIYRVNDKLENIISLDDIDIPGRHNIENLMPALIVWKLLGGKKIKDLSGFKLAPHRIEFVLEHNNRIFINDSKATNMHSTLKALESFDKPIFLLMGGRSKNQFHKELPKIIGQKVSRIIAFGESKDEIFQKLSEVVAVTRVGTLKEATQTAFKEARGGTTILLSPGGSSFDEFKNFEERGEKYKNWVKKLINQ